MASEEAFTGTGLRSCHLRDHWHSVWLLGEAFSGRWDTWWSDASGSGLWFGLWSIDFGPM